MGSGIAAVSAINEHEVRLVDVNNDLLHSSRQKIQQILNRTSSKKFPQDQAMAKAFFDRAISRISFTTDIPIAVKHSALIIEAIAEDIEIKKRLFRKLDELAPKTCIFSTNTSSLPINDIASAISRPELMGGLHFFNPVPAMRLVEIVRTAQTSDSTVKFLCDFAKSLGKTVVLCKDTPGFIVNRLLVPYLVEAVRMYERGDASIADIDTAMRLGAGYPMGPFELSDYVGLDTMNSILSGWAANHPDEPAFKLCRTMQEMVKAGRLGKKSGHGFYKYDEKGQIVST
ncbi:hypothetical protein SprV_0501791600 [Sparganum proliferum]